MDVLRKLWPAPRRMELRGGVFKAPAQFQLSGEIIGIEDDMKCHSGGYPIEFRLDDSVKDAEGYRLEITRHGMEITARTRTGLFYGGQTVLQIIRYGAGEPWRELLIDDAPQYRKRCFMADMGRSVFPLPMLKQLVKILSRLKMNQLHLHLLDDELCGIRLEGLPFGSENPYALTIADLGELVKFAAGYHVEIVPELEGWGHVGSITAHCPELRGGPGVYNGSSFLLNEKVFRIMRQMLEQVVSVMPGEAVIHLGLDEALWFAGDDQEPDFNPEKLVRRYYDMLQNIGCEQRKHLTMRIWGDHAGRPVPPEIRPEVIVEPWCYWSALHEHMDNSIERYKNGKSRWMAGAGQSMGQFRGAYQATRYWAEHAVGIDNLDGINITFWGRNDLENHFITLFAGSGYIWNPRPEFEAGLNVEDREQFERVFYLLQVLFQSSFREAWPDTLRQLHGPAVFNGYHWFNEHHGQPLTPLVPLAGTARMHNFLDE